MTGKAVRAASGRSAAGTMMETSRQAKRAGPATLALAHGNRDPGSLAAGIARQGLS